MINGQWSMVNGQCVSAQINTDRVLLMGRNALYYEDYVLAIQRFNMVINVKPWLGEPYFYRALAKFYLEDYQGAEIDAGHAVERNPYALNHYVLRALCRINQNRYALAEEDYRKAISINPLDHNSWHNIVLCQIELKEYARADSSLDVMLRHWGKEPEQYTMKAQVALLRADTVQAEKWADRALELDEYDGKAWSMKAMFQGNRKEYKEAEASLDKAIVQLPRMAGLYVNRALARYNQDNLRGAMSDYDACLDLEPRNYLAHYNRGLLRANVGEDNLAIEDFNFVLELEPDNTIALYNRALLLDNIGDYKGAIRDISAVIKDYPEFWDGYRQRAAIKRKIGDVNGAERDEFKVLQARLDAAQGKKHPVRTRKKSEHNIEDYAALVEEDEHEEENEYVSEYRGKVQNRQTELQPEPIYSLTYYRKESETNTYVAYLPDLERLNAGQTLPRQLFLTDNEAPMTEKQTEAHQASALALTEELEQKPGDKDLLMRRALDYYHIRDFENAVSDMNALIQEHGPDALALILRAQCRFAQLEVSRTTASASDLRLGYLMAVQDFSKASDLMPDVPFLHYNIGCVQVQLADYMAAQKSFSRALELDPHFPSAYYGRGVAYILGGQTEQGLSDLSQAGELGLYTAYNLIKKYSKQLAKKP
ncbi:MAG: tetratricopeptide repeat protein [Bacteroidaceae bacterium]|nr:tetratricopeptide repeat protein [Bacteroidaceae bacterium]